MTAPSTTVGHTMRSKAPLTDFMIQVVLVTLLAWLAVLGLRYVSTIWR